MKPRTMPRTPHVSDEPRTKKPWQKILFEYQDYPDNYVPPTFLNELKKNTNPRFYTFKEVIINSSLLIQQASCVITFVSIFKLLRGGWLISSCALMLLLASAVIVFAIVLYLHCNTKTTTNADQSIASNGSDTLAERHNARSDLYTLLLIFLLITLWSPLLNTLTESVSTDTIYAMTTVMFCCHLIFYDYGFKTPLVQRALSFNSALFASVCLSSRLEHSWETFAVIWVALLCFLFVPVWREKVMREHPSYVSVVSVVGFLTGVVLMYLLFPMIYTLLFTAGCGLLVTVCPAYLIYLQQYKSILNGPWDEACC